MRAKRLACARILVLFTFRNGTNYLLDTLEITKWKRDGMAEIVGVDVAEVDSAEVNCMKLIATGSISDQQIKLDCML